MTDISTPIDITSRKVVGRWAQSVADGLSVTDVARHDGKVVGYGSMNRRELAWMRHLSEVRGIVAPEFRRCGLSGVLALDIFGQTTELGSAASWRRWRENGRVQESSPRIWDSPPRWCWPTGSSIEMDPLAISLSCRTTSRDSVPENPCRPFLEVAQMPSMKPPSRPRRPSRLLRALEGRAVLELGALAQALPWLSTARAGDGHAVLVLPGYLASDRSTRPLRSLLRSKKYGAEGWDLGRNQGFGEALREKLTQRLVAAHTSSGEKVSLVGWSLGGVYARELARTHPQLVRRIVTLGSPIRLFSEWVDLEVPSTAIYSATDGIVSPESCLEGEGEFAENIRVPGSHCGLGHNPWAVWAILDRLAQPIGVHRPFAKSWQASTLYPAHSPGPFR